MNRDFRDEDLSEEKYSKSRDEDKIRKEKRGGTVAYMREDEAADIQNFYWLKTKNVLWYILFAIEILLGLRLLFLLLAASRVGFTTFLYGITDPFVTPFYGIFAGTIASLVSETIAAMVIYFLIGWGIILLLDLIFRTRER